MKLLDLLPEIIKNVSTISVVVVGLWVLYNYWRGRVFQKKLLINVRTKSKALDQKHVLFIEVELTNKSKVKLGARRVGPGEYVYKDKYDQLKYSCSLQIKRIDMKKIAGETYLDWYRCPALEPVSDIPSEINLLDDNVDPSENHKIVFWMEPGDIVQLSAPLILQAGHYLLKVSFFGVNREADYWSRIFYVSLPVS